MGQFILSPMRIKLTMNYNYLSETKIMITYLLQSGLISLILLVIGLINGIAALWSQDLSKLVNIRSVYSKLFHNIAGVAGLVVFNAIKLFNL